MANHYPFNPSFIQNLQQNAAPQQQNQQQQPNQAFLQQAPPPYQQQVFQPYQQPVLQPYQQPAPQPYQQPALQPYQQQAFPPYQQQAFPPYQQQVFPPYQQPAPQPYQQQAFPPYQAQPQGFMQQQGYHPAQNQGYGQPQPQTFQAQAPVQQPGLMHQSQYQQPAHHQGNAPQQTSMFQPPGPAQQGLMHQTQPPYQQQAQYQAYGQPQVSAQHIEAPTPPRQAPVSRTSRRRRQAPVSRAPRRRQLAFDSDDDGLLEEPATPDSPVLDTQVSRLMLSDEPDEKGRQEPQQKQQQAVVAPNEQQIQVKETGLIDIQPASMGVTGSRQNQTGSQQDQELALTTTGSSETALNDASTIEYSFDNQPNQVVFQANAHKYTAASLTNAIARIRLTMQSSQRALTKYWEQEELSQEDDKKADDEMAQVRGCKAKIAAFESELMRRGPGARTIGQQPEAPTWPLKDSTYQKKTRQYDVLTEDDFPAPSNNAGQFRMDDPLVNEYRPTDYPPRPVTKSQRQLGEIVIAEYPYWCSKCRLFGHKADWCDLWKEKAYLWYYAYVQQHNLPKSEHCTKCLKAGYPDAARNHMTKHCGLLVPYDHPENVSFAKLAVQPSEIEKFARPYKGSHLVPLPRCLIFRPGDMGYKEERRVSQHETTWNLELLGFDRMLAGMISSRHQSNKNDSVAQLNKATEKVWTRLTGQPCLPHPGARNKTIVNTTNNESGWGNIPVEMRASCTSPDYFPGASGWWNENFLADTLPLLTQDEKTEYDIQKDHWTMASRAESKVQGMDQKKKHINSKIRARRSTWEQFFHKICHQDEFARRRKALKEAEKSVKYEAKSDPIRRVDFKVLDEAALGHHRTGRFTDSENEDLVSARPLQLQHDFANAADCQQRIDYIKRQVALFWNDKVLHKLSSWIEEMSGLIRSTVSEHADRSVKPALISALRTFQAGLELATSEYAEAMLAVARGSDDASTSAGVQYEAMLKQATAAELKYTTATDAVMQALYNKDTEKAFAVLKAKDKEALLFIQGGCRLAKLPIAMDPRLLFPPREFCNEPMVDDKPLLEGLTPAWEAIPQDMLLEEGKTVE